MPDEEPKLIIDTDWKSQAQAEKERLAAKAAPVKPAPGAPAAPGAAPAASGQSQDEPVRFEEIVRMFAMQALSYLGEVPDPRSGQRVFAPEYARLYIDMLGVLEEKTKGNLSPEEDAMLKGVVGDLRLTYVEMNQAVAKAVAEGKIKPQQAGGVIKPAAGGVIPGGVIPGGTIPGAPGSPR